MSKYSKMSEVFRIEVAPDDFYISPFCVNEEYDDGDAAHEYAAHAINSHDELVAAVERLRARCEELEKDAARWSFVLAAADEMKTSRYETLCSLLRVEVDEEFDLAKQIDEAKGRPAA